MQTTKLSEINIYDIGNEIQTVGIILSGLGHSYVLLIPEKSPDLSNLELLPLTLDEWTIIFKQMDILETEIFEQDASGITKKLIRKSQRTIDNYLQWACFKRDNYSCRYCGRDGIPMSVDHIDLWEDGGPAILENLITSCRQCNKDRGRVKYEDWITSSVYKKKSEKLPESIKQQNFAILTNLSNLRNQRVKNIRSR